MSQEAELNNPNYTDDATYTGDTTHVDALQPGTANIAAPRKAIPPLMPPHCTEVYHFRWSPTAWCDCGPPPLSPNIPNPFAYPHFIATGSLRCSGWYDGYITQPRMREHEFDYISQQLGFEGIDDFNVVQGVFDNGSVMRRSDARALLLSMRDERWVRKGWAPSNIDMSGFAVRTISGTNVPADAIATFEFESLTMSGTTSGPTAETSESWNGSRPWEYQDPYLLGAERHQARGLYCIWCGHSGRDFNFPTDPVGPLQYGQANYP